MTKLRTTVAGSACSILTMLVAGCAGGVPEYKEPPVATVAVKDTQARIVLRSAGMPMAVRYAMSTSDAMCESFTPIGRVFHSGREQLLPWIAALTEKSRKAVSNDLPQIEQIVDANRRVQIKGFSGWSDVGQPVNSSGTCGPLFSQFTPAPGKTYLVEFRFAGASSCSQQVYEIGANEERSLVPQAQATPCIR